MLNQKLQQKLGLRINPLQIQFIKLIELPTYQLEQRIKEELEDNPLLEEGKEVNDEDVAAQEDLNSEEEGNELNNDEFSLEDYMDDDETPEYKLTTSNTSKGDNDKNFVVAGRNSFRENLINQLGERTLSEEDHKIAEYIIGNLDDDGYLRRDIDSIVDDLSFLAGLEVTNDIVSKVLYVIQSFDPAGVGARNLQECLDLQIKRKLEKNPDETLLKDAEVIISDYFEDLSKKHYEKIGKAMQMRDERLKEVIDVILKLNPRPGGGDGDAVFEGSIKVIPDFTLELIDGELHLSLNADDVPDLRINRSYINLLDRYGKSGNEKEHKDVVTFVKYKLNSAQIFIDAIKQRNMTLMLAMSAIVEFQKNFFMTGDKSQLKPMILKDIADITGLDVSTLSRVSNSKYIQTWFGIFSLKEFFSGSMTNMQGEEISTGEIKNVLKGVVNDEDKKNPYTDDELVEIMEKKGYKIARRTIAKYRQILDIPVARLRRLI
ncbi:MAG: RNA polymerase factor sigma-54 [Culturomica sp.]|nr:RNA polymerase factor sigma-54 [Culturomica sp.]